MFTATRSISYTQLHIIGLAVAGLYFDVFFFLFSQRVRFCSDSEKHRGLARLRLQIIGISFNHSFQYLRSNASTFLLIRTLGASYLLFGFLFVCQISFPEHINSQLEVEDGDDFRELTLSLALQHYNYSRTPLTNDSVKNRYVRTDITNN